jgi:KDO2-lipid IV(A) lauroyltransferase
LSRGDAAPEHDSLQNATTAVWQRLVLGVLTHSANSLKRMPAASASRFGAALGRLGYRVAGRSRDRALANLSLAYGDSLTTTQRRSLVRAVFEHFGKTTVEFLRAPALTTDALSALVTCEGWDHVEAARERGRGVILSSGHIGNWEIMGRYMARVRGLAITVVARDPRNPALAAYLRRMREDAGFAVLSKGESARDLLKVLKRGEEVIILSDQNSGDLFLPFFGVPAGTAAGPASLALHTGAAIVPVFCLRNPDGTFRLVCHPLVVAESTGNRDADVTRIMTEVNRLLEATIRQHPDQWLWLHNRWKSAFEPGNHARAWSDEALYSSAVARWRA